MTWPSISIEISVVLVKLLPVAIFVTMSLRDQMVPLLAVSDQHAMRYKRLADWSRLLVITYIGSITIMCWLASHYESHIR